MKSVRFLFPLVLMSLATVAVAQTEATKPADKPVTTDAEKSFSLLKRLRTARGTRKCVSPAFHSSV